MKRCNVLITSAGRRVSLLRLFQQALRSLEVEGEVVAVDLQAHAPALHVAEQWETVPRVTEEGYLEHLLELCRRYQICLVVPTIDTELHILASAREQFEAEGITLLVCSNEVNQIAFDKRSTQQFLLEHQLPAPRLYLDEEALALPAEEYPLLLKPARGSCSVGVTRVNNREELQFFLDYLDDPIIQEFVTGDEYTFDVLLGLEGEVLCVVPRLRMETRAGEVSKSITIRDPELINGASQFAEILGGGRGCITIQGFKQIDGTLKFIEINPRFGGGYPLSAEAGADYPRWILQMVMGLPLGADMQERWRDGLVMLRYDEAVFIDQRQAGL